MKYTVVYHACVAKYKSSVYHWYWIIDVCMHLHIIVYAEHVIISTVM